MSRYIDADDMIDEIDLSIIENIQPYDSYDKVPSEVDYACSALRDMIKRIRRIPPADVEPVRHGRWKPYDDAIHACSICGFTSHRAYDKVFKYCPNCGARMDGESDE